MQSFFNTLFFFYQLLVGAAVLALCADWYANGGLGYGWVVPLEAYYAVGLAVLLAPAFWAAMHLMGGILLGFASGGFLDGIKLGLILGVGMALAKLWPYALAAGVGVYLGGGPVLYAVAGIVAGMLLYALDWSLRYFWKTSSQGEGF